MSKFEQLKSLRAAANWKIVKKRHNLLLQLYLLTSDWKVQLPNLREIFEPEEIDWLLSQAAKSVQHCYYLQCKFIEFVASTGYQDEPEFNEVGKLQRLHRTTAVHHAAKFHNNHVLLDLFKIYNKFHVNYVDESGLTHFHVACEFGLDNVVKKFLDHGEDPNFLVTRTGNSPLHMAVAINNKEATKLVELLLRRGADPNLANICGSTPLHIICKRTDDDDDLLKTFFDICDDRQQVVEIDAEDESGNTPLHKAVASDNIEVAKVLLRRGADPNIANNDGSTALHLVAMYINDNGVNDLMETFFDICDNRQLEVQVDALDNGRSTPLHFVLYNDGDPQFIELLLRRGANPNLVDLRGKSPLHMICKRASSPQKLLAMFPRLAQLDVMDTWGRTPLQWAVENLLPRVVDILLDHGADLSSFVFPTANDFDKRFDRRVFSNIYDSFKLRMASGLMVIVENLEEKGYKFNRSEALTIMRFFAKHDLFENSFDEFWYNNEEWISLAQTFELRPNLSLYKWSRLTPKEEEKLLTYEDYFTLSEFDDVSILPEGVRDAYQSHMCEMMSRGFFLVWALDPFLELIHNRLPLECSDMVLSNLRNQDLYHICLAAAGQSL